MEHDKITIRYKLERTIPSVEKFANDKPELEIIMQCDSIIQAKDVINGVTSYVHFKMNQVEKELIEMDREKNKGLAGYEEYKD